MNFSEDKRSAANSSALILQPALFQGSRPAQFCELLADLKIPLIELTQDYITHRELVEISNALRASENTDGRDRVILFGAFLDEQISVAAHVLLTEGHDTLLVRDLIVVKDPQHSSFHDLRLLQAGAMLMTSVQLAYEWAVMESNVERRTRLIKFVDQVNDPIAAPR